MLHNGRNQVTVLEKLPKLGSALGKTTKWVLLDKCDVLGVNLIKNVEVTEIGDDFVNYLDANGRDQTINAVDYVYYATGVIPDDDLSNQIKEHMDCNIEKIGDARKPETVMEAVSRGYKIGNNV